MRFQICVSCILLLGAFFFKAIVSHRIFDGSDEIKLLSSACSLRTRICYKYVWMVFGPWFDSSHDGNQQGRRLTNISITHVWNDFSFHFSPSNAICAHVSGVWVHSTHDIYVQCAWIENTFVRKNIHVVWVSCMAVIRESQFHLHQYSKMGYQRRKWRGLITMKSSVSRKCRLQYKYVYTRTSADQPGKKNHPTSDNWVEHLSPTQHRHRRLAALHKLNDLKKIN